MLRAAGAEGVVEERAIARKETSTAVRWGFAGALVGAALCSFFVATEPGAVLEGQALDLAYRYLGPPRPPPDDIALLLVDAGSLLALRSFYDAEEGESPEEPWPWQRLIYGAVVDFLHQSGARAVALDFDFSGDTPNDELRDDTQAFAAVLRQAPIAHLALTLKKLPAEILDGSDHFRELARQAADVIARQSIAVREERRLAFEDTEYNSAQVPNRQLSEPGTARRMGFVNGVRDPDDSVRRTPILIRVGDHLVPSLNFSLAYEELGTPEVAVTADGSLRVGERTVPLDPQGRLILNWYGDERAIPSHPIHWTIKVAFADYERRAVEKPLYPPNLGWSAKISAAEVEEHRRLFRDKIVLIGVNAPELGDVYTNPFTQVYPGVAIHATALANVLRDEVLARSPLPWRIAVICAVALVCGVLPPLVGGERRGLAVYAVALLAVVAAFVACFRIWLVWVDLAAPCLAASLSFGGAVFADYMITGRQKRQLRATFNRVLQPALVDHLLSDPSRLVLGGEVRRLTSLFTDLQNSTALSERLAPQEWVGRLNRYFSECTEIVIRRRAYLDKYIGDGILCVWGAPVSVPGQETEACLAVLELRARLDEVEREIREEFGVELATRMGMNTGDVVVGMVGGKGLSHYTVLGDAVVIASRLEGANKYFGTRILIGEETYDGASHAIEAREVDSVVLKGKAQPLRIYEPLARKGELGPIQARLVEEYARALGLFRERRWDEAIRCLERLLEAVPGDGPSRLLLDRACRYREEPPPESWRGEHVLSGK